MSTLRSAVERTIPCFLLACLGLAALWMARRSVEQGSPKIDFSHTVQTRGGLLDEIDRLDHLRFAVASMVGAEATFSTYQHFVRRVCLEVGRKEAFIVRPSYARVREALERGEVDVAFVCTGTYLYSLRDKSMRLLVQPVFRDSLDYRCLVIVPAQSSVRTLDDLRGAVMAFTDAESNTGCLVPCATMLTRGLDPKSYFRKVVFTGSHDRSIMAVAHSVVDGAAV